MKSLLATITLAILFSFGASAQYYHGYDWVHAEWGDKWYSANRLQIGFGISPLNMTYSGGYEDYTNDNVSYSKFATNFSVTGYHFSMGFSYPVTHTGPKSALTINVNAMYATYVADNLNVTFNSSGNATGFAALQVGFPLSLEIRTGCDAFYDKQQKFCYGFGAGVMPNVFVGQLAVPDMNQGGVAYAKISPLLKAEFGFMVGICAKLRLTYVMQKNVDKIDEHEYFVGTNKGKGNTTPTPMLSYKGTLSQSAPIMLTLVLYPASFLWGRDR